MQSVSFHWRGFVFSMMLIVGVTSALSSANALYPVVAGLGKAAPQPQENIFATAANDDLSPAPEAMLAAAARSILTPTIAEMVPMKGKFIGVDLVEKKLYLYENGGIIAEYPVLAKGRKGTPWETPSGSYSVQTKERTHFSSIGKVNMDYSMQFFGNYFIHGWPYYPDGTPVPTTYSGGCIRLSNETAAKVFEFADIKTPMYVYDPHPRDEKQPLSVLGGKAPTVTAKSYLVADLDTGDVLLEKNAQKQLPIASITKLMTALVANETISFETKLQVARGLVGHPRDPKDTKLTSLSVNDLQYPLLMESNNTIAETLAAHYDTAGFVRTMNTAAKALNMRHTNFEEPTGLSKYNTSTADDIFRLSSYLEFRKPFVFEITRTPQKTLISDDGSTYLIKNFNQFSLLDNFIGGKIGFTDEAAETMVSLFELPVQEERRRVAIVVLDSLDKRADTETLEQWVEKNTTTMSAQSACALCAAPKRRIEVPRD